MKVNIYETVEVSDEQRTQIARLEDGDGAKKRPATRDEIKAFVWSRGSGWATDLSNEIDGAPAETETEDEDEDLLGEDDEDLI